MFVFLSKFLPLFAYPLGLASVFLLILLFTAKLPVWQRAILLGALLVLFLGGNRLLQIVYLLLNR